MSMRQLKNAHKALNRIVFPGFLVFLMMLFAFKVDVAAEKATSKSIDGALVKTEYKEDTSQDYGYDDFTNPDVPWKSVKTGGNDPVTAEIKPAAVANKIFFKSTATGKITVSPTQAGGSPQTVTLTGVAKGTSEIQANGGKESGPTTGKMKGAAYDELTETLAVRLVHEDNDDTQVIPVGQGKPNQTAITAGTNGTLDTTPAGDDAVSGTTIHTGADGICNTTKSGDDVQVIASGKGKSGEKCVGKGTNGKRDTKTSGDDSVSGEDIDTGADGICNTAANSTDIMSTNLGDAAITAKLEKVYGQAVWSWTLTRLPAKTVNFDLDLDGKIDVNTWMSVEMQVVRDECKDDTKDHNIFFVDNPSDGSCGFMNFNQRYGYVHVGQCTGTCNMSQVVCHELGHGNGLHHKPADSDNLMYNYCNGDPWRLRKDQWDQLNP